MSINKPWSRGILDEDFLVSLKKGTLSKMLTVVNNDQELDVQIRNNYINIYYNGGNIAKITSATSIDFDKFYFYTDSKTTSKKSILNNDNLLEQLNIKKNDLITKFKNGQYKDYFENAKQIIDHWIKENPKPERLEQHKLAIANTYGKSDYTIIDLEYQVSSRCPFACEFINMKNNKPKIPRFDIIAIDRKGTLCIIELKKGIKALKYSAGLEEHLECYKSSIGRNYAPFVKEMQQILAQKKDFKLIDNRLEIENRQPIFLFAFAYDHKDTIEKQDTKFDAEVRKFKNSNTDIKIIKLRSNQLLDI